LLIEGAKENIENVSTDIVEMKKSIDILKDQMKSKAEADDLGAL